MPNTNHYKTTAVSSVCYRKASHAATIRHADKKQNSVNEITNMGNPDQRSVFDEDFFLFFLDPAPFFFGVAAGFGG